MRRREDQLSLLRWLKVIVLSLDGKQRLPDLADCVRTVPGLWQLAEVKRLQPPGIRDQRIVLHRGDPGGVVDQLLIGDEVIDAEAQRRDRRSCLHQREQCPPGRGDMKSAA